MSDLFNQQAAAENYSLREALMFMKERQLDFLGAMGMPRDTQLKFRGLVIQMVLGTEMARHFDIVGQFEAQVALNQKLNDLSADALWTSLSEAQRVLTLQMALKVADLGHCALPLDQHMVWLERLNEEFLDQGDEERGLGLNISPLMDRDKPGVTAPASQVFFFQMIVMPLLSTWVTAFPACQPILQQARDPLSHGISLITLNPSAHILLLGWILRGF